MKTLFLMRHAKSSWDDPDLKDFERPLNARGLRDVPAMAKRFRESGHQLQAIVSSPAERASSTARLFAVETGFGAERVTSNPELYFAGVGMFLKAASLFDDQTDAAMLVGHNPTLTEFANAMANADIDNIPTCGLVELELPINHWSEVVLGQARLAGFDYPKKTA